VKISLKLLVNFQTGQTQPPAARAAPGRPRAEIRSGHICVGGLVPAGFPMCGRCSHWAAGKWEGSRLYDVQGTAPFERSWGRACRSHKSSIGVRYRREGVIGCASGDGRLSSPERTLASADADGGSCPHFGHPAQTSQVVEKRYSSGVSEMELWSHTHCQLADREAEHWRLKSPAHRGARNQYAFARINRLV
jgi:hypothetical protein